MPRLADLGLTNEQVGQPIDYAEIPDQFGGFSEPPQPGEYRVKLPQDLSAIWEVFDHTNGNPPGKRLRAKFDDAHPLVIIQSPDGRLNGEPFQTSISNAERRRGKKDDPTAPFVSDMDYILRDVWQITQKPKTNAAYAQEFQKHGGSEMGLRITWNWFCNPKKNIFTDNGQGGFTEVQQAGCGTSYYMKDIEKVPVDPNNPLGEKVYPLRITCQCGANVRAFANVEGFKP